MRQYYYTIAALPAVTLEEPPFFDEERFLDHCRAFLHPRDLAYLHDARISPAEEGESSVSEGAASGVLAAWNLFRSSVYAYGAVARAQSLEWEFTPPAIDADPVLAERIRLILAEDTPLKSESSLLRTMWSFLEEIGIGHFFDREAIVIYYLKLQLALRYQRITDNQAGREEFDRQYEELSKALMEIDT